MSRAGVVSNEHRTGLARIQVAATLRRARERAGVTRGRAAAELYCTTSKIGDLETGRSRPNPAELGRLLDLYGVTGTDRDQLLRTARDACSRRRSPPESGIPVVDQRFFDLESQARKITYFSSELVPGFLQTDAYARALVEWRGDLDVEEADRRVALRATRRTLLRRDGASLYWAILGEAALRANVGGPEVMADQLRELVRAGNDLGNVVVQILPMGAGAHGSIGVTRTLLEFDPPAGPVLHVDTNVRNVFYDDAADVARATRELDLIKTQALRREPSRALIDEIACEYDERIRHAPS